MKKKYNISIYVYSKKKKVLILYNNVKLKYNFNTIYVISIPCI